MSGHVWMLLAFCWEGLLLFLDMVVYVHLIVPISADYEIRSTDMYIS